MWPTVFTIPWLNLPIRGYGLMLMIGFLGGTWWAAQRAARVKCDPDFVINMGFAALLSSVVGARLFYVIHYWDSHFAGRGLKAVIDITAGGMEFYGGFIGAFAAVLIYMWIRRVSFRLYMDILAPSLMFGMGMARIGCFLNGCCWGAVCEPSIPWSVRFPYASPAAYRQWEERVITYPAELISVLDDGAATLIPRDELMSSADRELSLESAYNKAQQAVEQARANHADAATIDALEQQQGAALKKWREAARELTRLRLQMVTYRMSPAELRASAAASEHRTHAVHPAQLYASLDGLLLAVLLNALFYRRKHHGVVVGVLFLCYPIMRFIEEIIRSDNPHDVIGLTISQFISLAIFTGGVILLTAVYRMPARATTAAVRSTSLARSTTTPASNRPPRDSRPRTKH
ncbi:MAG: prolipoprotein diacylglyceryl transferase [Planctomycetes bacterium]|nr:prolipoprotein diacylglyceryl transferase [Planctomycetota bacterium]